MGHGASYKHKWPGNLVTGKRLSHEYGNSHYKPETVVPTTISGLYWESLCK